MDNKIKTRLELIQDRIEGDEKSGQLKDFTNDLYNTIRDIDIFKSIVFDPISMVTGSIAIYLSTFPSNVYLKLWRADDTYYLSYFSKRLDYFEVQLIETFNKEGILPIDNLDEAEERILDLITNAVYSQEHTTVLSNQS